MRGAGRGAVSGVAEQSGQHVFEDRPSCLEGLDDSTPDGARRLGAQQVDCRKDGGDPQHQEYDTQNHIAFGLELHRSDARDQEHDGDDEERPPSREADDVQSDTDRSDADEEEDERDDPILRRHRNQVGDDSNQ